MDLLETTKVWVIAKNNYFDKQDDEAKDLLEQLEDALKISLPRSTFNEMRNVVTGATLYHPNNPKRPWRWNYFN